MICKLHIGAKACNSVDVDYMVNDISSYAKMQNKLQERKKINEIILEKLCNSDLF